MGGNLSWGTQIEAGLLPQHLPGISSLKITVFHLEGIKRGGKQAAGLGSPHRQILGSERPIPVRQKSQRWDVVEVQACCWWCLGAERWREELRSFSRCTGTLTTALQNRIRGKLFTSGSLSGFSVAETFCLWNISLVNKLPSCAALLSFHMLHQVQSDWLHKNPVKSDVWC